MTLLRNKKARATRRAFPIHAYVGANGGGKSCAAVWDSLPSLDAGRQVLSTVRLLDWRNPRPCDDPLCTALDHATHKAAHPMWVPLTEWRQLLEVEHCDVIMDEVTGIASARESQSMPAPVANFLVQLRRRDIVLRWTSPNWRRADVIIRECTQAATICRGFLPVAVETGAAEEERLWRHRRLFRWTTYDAADFDDFTEGKRESLKPWKIDMHWGPGSPVFSAYDTFDAVLSLGMVTEGGRCMDCGGRKRAEPCSCHRPDTGDAPARTRRRGGPPLAGSVLLEREGDPAADADLAQVPTLSTARLAG